MGNTTRTYKGCNIYPITRPTTWGGRWESYVNGRWVAAQTLADVKRAITNALSEDPQH